MENNFKSDMTSAYIILACAFLMLLLKVIRTTLRKRKFETLSQVNLNEGKISSISKKKIDAIFLGHILLLCFVFYFSTNPLSPDEAHYVQWSRNLDLAYYSKGPLLAFVIYCSTLLFGFSEHAVRFPALFFTIATFSFIYALIKEKYNSKNLKIIYAVMMSTVSLLYPALLMTTDAPVLFFWVTSVYYLSRYLTKRDNVTNLYIGLFLLGFGLWTKYTIVVVLCVFSFLLVFQSKSFKKLLFELTTTTIISVGFLLPIIYWNYQHEWVNFSHNAAHAGSGITKGIKISYFFDFIGSQVGVYGIFFFLIFKEVYKKTKVYSRTDLLPIFSSTLLFLICLLVSFTKRIYPNWTIPAFLVLLVYMAPLLVELYNNRFRLYLLSIGVNALITLAGILLMFGYSFGVKGNILPTKKLHAWPEYTEKVRELKNAYPESPLIITDSYDIISELGFYAPELKVYNASLGGRRMNQYDIWERSRKSLSGLENSKVILLLGDVRNVELFQEYFQTIQPVQPLPYYHYDFNGSKIRNLNAYIASNYKGKVFPDPQTR